MKPLSKILVILSFAMTIVSAQIKNTDLTKYVNPLVGTDSEFKLSNGNTYPAIAVPWGMNFWTPQTGKNGDGWAYTYDAYKIRGFKQTHQPSPWINDYAAYSIMPVTGKPIFDEEKRASWFSHKAETVLPHYYKVYLADHDVTTEITPTDRAVQFNVTYPETDEAYIVIDAYEGGSYVKIIPEENKVIGFCRNNHGGVPENFHNYFVIKFSKEFDDFYTWNDSIKTKGNKVEEGNHVGAIIKFKTAEDEIINIKAASSFISFEQAELNLTREIGNDSFSETRAKAKQLWNNELNRIEIEGADKDQLVTFYTALYRTLLFPRKFYELNKEGKVVHYSPYNGKVLDGYMFTDNGFWDTFRAVFPFFNLMYPEQNSKFMQGLVNTYKESGWLPEWASPGHRDCMIGSNSAAIISDAYLKGVRGFDIETLYEAILKNSESVGPLNSVGRYGAEYYNKLGFVPYNVGINENVARTLEYSYADFTIWKLAKALNKPQNEIDTFAKRASNYKTVFDKSTNFMRGKNEDGSWQKPFVPEKWGDAFTEGSSWHYTWSVFHDPAGLMDLMGGKQNFIDKLDSVFTAPPVFDDSYYGYQIHEITEMLIADMGQYAHGNQPIQHAVYLYDYAGAPWKTQKWVREIMDKLYTPNPDGLCGDEDNGQTSAWYVFSALGFYPVCPGTDEYALGSPLFENVKLYLQNGNTFKITASENSCENIYIRKAFLNSKEYTKNFIKYDEIQNGGNLKFEMSNKPNLRRGINKSDLPYSYSEELK